MPCPAWCRPRSARPRSTYAADHAAKTSDCVFADMSRGFHAKPRLTNTVRERLALRVRPGVADRHRLLEHGQFRRVQCRLRRRRRGRRSPRRATAARRSIGSPAPSRDRCRWRAPYRRRPEKRSAFRRRADGWVWIIRREVRVTPPHDDPHQRCKAACHGDGMHHLPGLVQMLGGIEERAARIAAAVRQFQEQRAMGRVDRRGSRRWWHPGSASRRSRSAARRSPARRARAPNRAKRAISTLP